MDEPNDHYKHYTRDQPQVPRKPAHEVIAESEKKKKKETEKKENDMSFLDHLEELRWHLIRSFTAMIIFIITCFVFSEQIWKYVILAPTKISFVTFRAFCKLSELTGLDIFCATEEMPFVIQSRKVFGQFTSDLSVMVVCGLVLTFPYIFWEIWRFLKPGLYPKERNAARGAVFFVSLLFFCGISFGYFLVAPLSLQFLSNYQVAGGLVTNEFDISSIISFLVTITLANGILFQLPMVSLFLAKAGVIHADMLRAYRKHSIVGILFISALLTPPDVISQILVSFPLVILYQISIRIVSRVDKKREAEFDM